MNEERFIHLFNGYLNDGLKAEELTELQEAVQDRRFEQLLDDLLKQAYGETVFAEENPEAQKAAYQHILATIQYQEEQDPVPSIPKSRFSRYRWLAGVAALLLIALGAGWFFLAHPPLKPVQNNYATDIKPGVNQAMLILSSGKKILLNGALAGRLAKESGVSVSKTKNGEIIYTADTTGNALTGMSYNTLVTARKEQYQLILPDGSHVWLDAVSSIKYPVAFKGKERLVELSGEAYFEVAHNTAMPFRVKTATQTVEVLGTHFNIKAYADEPAVKTTLLEGSVRVTAMSGPAKMLKPGQQAVNDRSHLTVEAVDTEEAVAWKNGYFMFDDEDLGTVMRKVARWYDVEVVYSDPALAKQVFSGSITRFTNISNVLDMLKKAGDIHFNVNGRTITVTP